MRGFFMTLVRIYIITMYMLSSRLSIQLIRANVMKIFGLRRSANLTYPKRETENLRQ